MRNVPGTVAVVRTRRQELAEERGGRAHRTAAPRGLVEGRARNQRHDGRRRPSPAGVPRDPHRRTDRRRGQVDSLAPARGRDVGQFLRRARRTSRRPSRPTSHCAWPATRATTSTSVARDDSFSPRAASRAVASSLGCGSRMFEPVAVGRATRDAARTHLRRPSTSRSTSTTSAAGRARRSSPSPS